MVFLCSFAGIFMPLIISRHRCYLRPWLCKHVLVFYPLLPTVAMLSTLGRSWRIKIYVSGSTVFTWDSYVSQTCMFADSCHSDEKTWLWFPCLESDFQNLHRFTMPTTQLSLLNLTENITLENYHFWNYMRKK